MTNIKVLVLLVVSLFGCLCSSSKTPLSSRDVWKTVANFSSPQSEQKFKAMHKSYNHIPSVYEDVSEEINGELSGYGDVPWRFFKHLESAKLFAENGNEEDDHGCTALHRATIMNLPKIVELLIDAKVDINALQYGAYSALHLAAKENYLEIGKMLLESGADTFDEDDDTPSDGTPLYVAKYFMHGSFVEMLKRARINYYIQKYSKQVIGNTKL